MNQIGPKIRTIREERGQTQEALAAKCCHVGLDINRSTLAKIESKVRRITDIEVALLAKALNVSVGTLFNPLPTSQNRASTNP